jgi:hypothetical protein
MNKLEEIHWKVIPNTNGFFQISSLGDVRKVNIPDISLSVHHLIKIKYLPVERVYSMVKLDEYSILLPEIEYMSVHGVLRKPISVLMFMAFHGISDVNWTEIFHLDGNAKNNSLDNLVLTTKEDKIRYLSLLRHVHPQNLLPAIDEELRKVYTSKRSQVCISEYYFTKLVNVYKNASDVIKKLAYQS